MRIPQDRKNQRGCDQSAGLANAVAKTSGEHFDTIGIIFPKLKDRLGINLPLPPVFTAIRKRLDFQKPCDSSADVLKRRVNQSIKSGVVRRLMEAGLASASVRLPDCYSPS